MLSGDAKTGLALCGFNLGKPVIVVTGGSQGSESINREVRKLLNELLKDYQVAHICGKGNVDTNLNNLEGYRQFEYLNEELPDVFAMADIFIARAGATTIFEILALKKLNILIPLSKKVSRGDQVLNAKSFEASGFSLVLSDDDEIDLLGAIKTVWENKISYYEKMDVQYVDSTENVINVIEKCMS